MLLHQTVWQVEDLPWLLRQKQQNLSEIGTYRFDGAESGFSDWERTTRAAVSADPFPFLFHSLPPNGCKKIRSRFGAGQYQEHFKNRVQMIGNKPGTPARRRGNRQENVVTQTNLQITEDVFPEPPSDSDWLAAVLVCTEPKGLSENAVILIVLTVTLEGS